MASPKPAVNVRREFEVQPDAVAQDLRACIVGPACQLVRFGVSDEQANGFIQTLSTYATPGANKYLFASDTAFDIPNIESTSVLDLLYTKVYVKNANLTYGAVSTVASTFSGSPTANNVITLTSGTETWKTSGGGTLASGLVQDVAVGDIVSVYTGSSPYSLAKESVVTGFIPDVNAAAVSSVSATIVAPVTKTSNITASAGGVTFTINTANYLAAANNQAADPRHVGATRTVYTLKVLGLSGSDPIVSFISNTGLDDVAEQVVTGSATAIGLSGLTIVVASGSVTAVGASTTVTVDIGHTSASMSPTSVSGTYTGTQDTTYYLTCIEGGALKTGVRFKISTNNGADSISTVTVTTSSAATQVVAVGSYGLSVTFPTVSATSTNYTQGFVKGDVLYFTATAATDGAIKTLVLADSLGAVYPTITKVALAKRKTVQIPQYDPNGANLNWEILNPTDPDTRQLEVKRDVVLRDSSLTASASTDLHVTAGDLYIEYRAFKQLPREVGSAITINDISGKLGTIDPDNLLAYGVYKAWQNANGQTVHYIPTDGLELNSDRGFADALAVATGNRYCYSMVPLTADAEVWDAFVGHVTSESAAEKGRFRILWIAPEVSSHNVILTTDANGYDLEGVQSGSGNNTVLTLKSGLVGNFTSTVRAGDFVRTNFEPDVNGVQKYDEYKVISVDSNAQLTIATNGDLIGVNAKFEIVRDLTSAALATEYVQVAGGFSSERVFAVVPDRGINGLKVGGKAVSNFYIACAFAGLRSGSRPQQPLANVELLGFDGNNTQVAIFDETDFDTLRDGGVWLVRNTIDGKIYAERQLSTSTLDEYRKEQSVTTNLDSISFFLRDSLKNLIGRVNITPGTKDQVRATMASALGSLTGTYGAVEVGPQLLSYEITKLDVAPTAKDTIVTEIKVSVPLPLNTIDATLAITV